MTRVKSGYSPLFSFGRMKVDADIVFGIVCFALVSGFSMWWINRD